MEKFLFLAAPAEEETKDGAIGGEEQVHVITILDFLGALQVLWLWTLRP